MKIDGLIWFDEIIEKLERKHNVLQNEVKEFYLIDLISALLRRAIN